jgi:pilus assembly protein Flp/PilA
METKGFDSTSEINAILALTSAKHLRWGSAGTEPVEWQQDCLASQKSVFSRREIVMREAIEVLKSFAKDEDGAALIEYTVLLGVLVVAVIATIGLVGNWVKGQWTSLCTAVGAATSASC